MAVRILQGQATHCRTAARWPEMVTVCFTCSEQRDGSQVGKLRGADVELAEGLDVVVDLADAGRHLLHVDGRVLPGQPGLLVAHDDGEEGGDGDLGTDLGQSQHEQVRPAVAHQPHLRLVPGGEQ